MQSDYLLVAKVCWVNEGGKQKHQAISSYSARALPQIRKLVFCISGASDVPQHWLHVVHAQWNKLF